MANIRNSLVKKLIVEIRELREKLKECTCRTIKQIQETDNENI
jgi:hypothetical protein